ncbi:4Fe-4S binding protein [candidate division KSB1 bacterium]|nr:4Fe-4S binding protein [candidate division KSB1 bacterium]
MQIARRITQVLFLLFFLILFVLAAYPYESFLPSDLFLRLDPLIGFTSSLAARKIILKTLLSLIVFLPTLLLGRIFCGWMCPLGTTLDGVDKFVKRKRDNQEKTSLFRFRWFKYVFLITIFTAALFSVQIAGYLDPISLLTRTMVTVIYPIFVFIVDGFIGSLFSISFIENAVFSVSEFLRSTILPVQSQSFQGSIFVGLIFIAILSLSYFQKRFWCRNLCPLGALLGISSKFRLYKRIVSDDCTSCSLCHKQCRMGAIESDYVTTDQYECINCMDCQTVCPVNAIEFKFAKKASSSKFSLDRRKTLQAGLSGLITMSFFKIDKFNTVNKEQVIRPPGALEEPEFLDRCVRCGECVRICSTSGAGLQVTALESGWEGLSTPALITPMGYCEHNCNLCGKVCPTGAIQDLTMKQKQEMKMGTAHFHKTRCIPWYYGDNCMVCEEHCPVSPKAIQFTTRTVTTIDGRQREVFLPFVEESLCVGCGICTKVCPVVGEKGIYLTNDGETRFQIDT